MKTEKISELTINRLSVYLRCLNELAEAGEQTVSSKTLAERFNLNSAQIRKDLAYFGEFGVRGVGYYVDGLRDQLMKILGLMTEHRVVEVVVIEVSDNRHTLRQRTVRLRKHTLAQPEKFTRILGYQQLAKHHDIRWVGNVPLPVVGGDEVDLMATRPQFPRGDDGPITVGGQIRRVALRV